MKIIYLKSTVEDLKWMRYYYATIFPEGARNARRQFDRMEEILPNHPFIGRKTHRKNVRKFTLSRTPFSVIYKVSNNRIEILRIWDERRKPTVKYFPFS